MQKTVVDTETGKTNVRKAASSCPIQDFVVNPQMETRPTRKEENVLQANLTVQVVLRTRRASATEVSSDNAKPPFPIHFKPGTCSEGHTCDFAHFVKANPAKEQIRLVKEVPNQRREQTLL